MMTFQEAINQDLAVFFNTGEFAREVDYFLGSVSNKVVVQFFDEESDLGDSMMRKLVVKLDDIPNISRNGYFIIDGEKYGVIDFMPDEQGLIQQVILQKGMI